MILPPAVPGSTTATTSESTEPPPWDDKDGHYVIIPGHCMGENDKCEFDFKPDGMTLYEKLISFV